MRKQLEFDGVEAEKAEAMRRYNNKKRFKNITRAAAVAFFCYLWFPTVTVSLQAACGWFYRTGTVMLTNRLFVFFFTNVLVALVCFLSRGHDGESTRVSSNEPDLYYQYTSSVTVTVTDSDEKVVDEDDSKKQIVTTFNTEVHEEVVVMDKQIVPAFAAEEVVEEAVITKAETRKKVNRAVTEIRRTKSERRKKVKAPEVMEFRRTESANSGIERLSSEEFRLKIETFIMEKKKSLVQEENGVVVWEERGSSGLELVGADSSSCGSC
ncbi:unnamed protein product [Eruca vesicaria subsp. sativa]|uniref:Transmembrane protein n=1 Tax=Eruca vesicaria subsp. sativa TaxID=29727 RepID=A0ABC8LI10_ERUVS|nr:unnamed protein product [Eruca vesicaria subsp. sativa]